MNASKRKKLVAGNWKMNGSLKSVTSLARDISKGISDKSNNTDVLVCPAFIHLSDVWKIIRIENIIKLGSQDVSVNDNGAFTGEISCPMLVEAGCSHVIVGHSERRQYHNESSELTADKANKALGNGLIPIICIGETLQERESDQTQTVIGSQVRAAINKLGINAFENIILAYEPIWAIGTGMTASPEQAQDVHVFIRSLLAQESTEIASKTLILYGGSVKPDNAHSLFSQRDIDGGLIGGAALNSGDFLAIIQAADQIQ